ncbi:MAG: TIGR04133 family radical SAM/SPASM protein [Muribaculaceae bacterium]|nr:TIGR04133 family radical SAM/SPASM protein [Muribaculaceae bacterium]
MKNNRHLTLRRRLALESFRLKWKIAVEKHELRTLFWESTQRCNVHCLHCGSDCKASTDIPDMPAEDFLKVVDTITPHVDPHKVLIIISGGEPLVRGDLEKVGRELYRREYPWGIVTNGFALTDSRLQSLRRAGLRSIAVSIDGLADTHNWLRGQSLSFEKAMHAIEHISLCPELVWDTITCVNKRNLTQLPQLKEELIKRGVKKWRLFTIFPMGRAAGQPDLQLSHEEYLHLMEFIKDVRSEGRIKASYCCEGFLGNYEGEVRDYFYHCTAGVSTASILIDGSISACGSIRSDFHQGNIYEDDFMTVWNNGFKQYRDRTWMKKDECADCKMWRYCEGNGMHLRDNNGSLLRCNYHELTRK